MNIWREERTDGLPRLVQLLVMAPIAIATVLVTASSFVLADMQVGRAPAVAMGGTAALLVIAALAAWFVMNRLVSSELQAVVGFLRAAKRGDAVEVPRALGGALRDIVDLVEDIIQTQVQVGRYVIGLEAIEHVSHTITDFAQTAKSEHASMSRAIMALAGDIKKSPVPVVADGSFDGLAGKIETSVTALFAQQNRRIDATQSDTKAIGAAIEALQTNVHAGTATTIDAVRDLIKANAFSRDSRPDVILARLQTLDTGLADARNDLAKVKSAEQAEQGQAQLLTSLGEIHTDVTRQLGQLGERVDLAISNVNLGPAASRIERAAQNMDGVGKELGLSVQLLGVAAKGIGSAAVPESIADLKIAVRDIKQVWQDARMSEAERSRIARDERAALETNVTTRIDDLRPVLEGVFDRIGMLTDTSNVTVGAVGDLRQALESQSDSMQMLSGQVLQGIEAAKSSTVARDFELVVGHLTRIGQQLDGVASDASKAPTALDAIMDVRQVLSAQTDAAGAQAETVGTVAAGIGHALTLLSSLNTADGKPLPSMLADGFDVMKTHLVAIATGVDRTMAASGATLTADGAAQAFESLRKDLDRIGDQLRGVDSNAATKATMVFETIAEVRHSLSTLGDAAAARAETVESVAAGIGQALTLLGDLSAVESKLRPATVIDLVNGFNAMKTYLAAIETRVEHAIAISGSNLTADNAASAFENLRGNLDRIADQLRAVEADAAKTSTVLDKVADVRHALSVQAEASGCQAETVATAAADIGQTLALLADLRIPDGKPLPAMVVDLVEGFETIKTCLVTIETRLDHAIAISGTSLPAGDAMQAFDRLRHDLERIGDQLQTVEAEAARTSVVLDRIMDIRQVVDTQMISVETIAADTRAALTALTSSIDGVSRVSQAMSVETSAGFTVLQDHQDSLNARINDIIVVANSNQTAEKASQEFDWLREALDLIGSQLQSVVSDSAKTSLVLDTVTDVRQSLVIQETLAGAQAETAGRAAAGIGQALAMIAELNVTGSRPLPAMVLDLVEGLDAIMIHLTSIETRLEHAITVSGSNLTAKSATEVFDTLRETLDRIRDQLQAVESDPVTRSAVLDAITDVRLALSAQTHATNEQAETLGTVALGIDQALTRLTALESSKDGPLPATALDLVGGFDAIRAALTSIETRVGQAIAASESNLTAGNAMQAFETLRDNLDRIGEQLHAVEVGSTTKSSLVLDTIADVRQALSAQADAVGAQAETVATVATGMNHALTLLSHLGTTEGPPLPAMVADGFDAMKTCLVAIEEQVGRAIAASQSSLTAEQAQHAFDTLRNNLGRLGEQLQSVESGTHTKTSMILDRVADAHNALGVQVDAVGARQAESAGTIAAELGQAISLLADLVTTGGKPLPAMAADLVDGFDAIKTYLAAIDMRVEQAVVVSGSNLTAETATQAFESLRDTLDRIGEQLRVAESGATRNTSTVLETITEVRQALNAQADAVGAQAETVGTVAAGMTQALALLTSLNATEGKPVAATAVDLVDGLEAIKSYLDAIETRVGHAIAVSESSLTAENAAQAFDALRDNLDRVGAQLHAVESAATTKTSQVLDTIMDVRQALNVQADAATAQADTAGIVAAGVSQALVLLADLKTADGTSLATTVVDGFSAIKTCLVAIEAGVGQAITVSGSNLTAETGGRAFDALRQNLDLIGQHLYATESGAMTKTSMVLDAITDVRHALTVQAAASGAQVETVGAMVAGMGQVLARVADLNDNEGKPRPATAVDLVDGFDAIRTCLDTIEARVGQAISISASSLTAENAVQAFDALRDNLDRIGGQLHAAELGATTTTSLILDTISDVRHVLSTKADAQAEMVGTVAAGMSQALDRLADLGTIDDKPLPALIVEGFDAIKTYLVAIEVGLGQAIAVSGSNLTVENAALAFGALRENLDRIGIQLQAAESSAAMQSSQVLDTITDVRDMVGAQTIVNATADDVRKVVTALTGSIEGASQASHASTAEVSADLKVVSDHLGALDARVADAIGLVGSSQDAEKATREFELLRGSLDRLGEQLQSVESDTAKTSLVLETVKTLPVVIAEQAQAAKTMARDVRQALTILETPPVITNDPPATAADLLVGLESLHDHLTTIALRVDETVAASGSAQTIEATRAAETQAATQRLMDAILTVRGLLNVQPAAVTESGPSRLTLETDGVATRLDEVNGRLDQLSERLELIVPETPALIRNTSSTRRDADQSGDPALVFDAAMLGRIDDLAARIDSVAELLEGMDRRQGLLEPIVTRAVAPVVDHVVKLADVSDQGFARLAGQFSQLSDTVSNVPKAVAQEARAVFEPPSIDLSPLNGRFDNLREGLDDLATSLEQAAHVRDNSQALSPGLDAAMKTSSAPSFAIDPTQFIGAEMDALHSRFDQLTARIEQLADVVDGDVRPFGVPIGEASPAMGNTLEAVSRDVLQRLDDLRSMLARVGMADLPPVVQRLETSNRMLVNVITEWRAAGSPVTRDVLEGAVEGLNRQLRDLGGTESIMVAINELRFVMQQVPANVVPITRPETIESAAESGAIVAGLYARFDDIVARVDRLAEVDGVEGPYGARQMAQNASVSSAALDATLAPIRQLTSLAEKALLCLQAKAEDPRLDREPSLLAEEAALNAAALADVKTQLDGIQVRIDRFAKRADTEHETLKRLATITESFNEEILVSRLDQSNQAIAETLLGFESRMEQPIAELRESIAAARALGSPAEMVTTPSTTSATMDEAEPLSTTSLVSALKTMSGFMAAIEERFAAVESIAEGVSASTANTSGHAGLEVFNEGIVEMRRLTHEFLDISCAITGELAEHAKPQQARMAGAM